MKRNALLVSLASVGMIVIVLLFLMTKFRPVQATAYIANKGSPLLVADRMSVEAWDPESSAIIQSKKIVLYGARQWDKMIDPSPSIFLVYSDHARVQGYWSMLKSGHISKEAATAFALGERAEITCVFVDSSGIVQWQEVYHVPFLEFRYP